MEAGKVAETEETKIDIAIDRAVAMFSHSSGGSFRRAAIGLASFIVNAFGSPMAGGASPAEDAPASEAADRKGEPESVRAAATLSMDKFVARVEKETETRDRRLDAEIQSVRAFDRTVFRLLLMAGVITLVLAVVGAGMAFGGMITVAIVSGAVAILPAAGTAILFRLQSLLQRKRKGLDTKRERNADSLEALRAIVAIDDDAVRKRRFLQYVADRRRSWVGATS